LIPWAERLAQEADAKLLPFGNRMLTTRFDLDWLAEGDAAKRAEADAKYVGAGIRTRNEVRADHGWNMHPDGEALTSQRQYWATKHIEELAEAEVKKTLAEAERIAAPPPAPAAPDNQEERSSED
jgi:hypothetical protein